MTTSTRLMLLIALATFGASGCMDWWPELGIPAGKQPWGEWNPVQGMHKSPAIKDQGEGMRYPAPGTIPVGFRPYPFGLNEADKSVALKNPVPITDDSLRYGKLMYETTCIVCHGAEGKGDGYVVGEQKYPAPPDLNSQRVRNWTDGQVYHVITHGQGRMWSYKSQLRPEERWAVVNYLRAVQRSQYPEPQDLERIME